jgi:hypothetical protein
MRCDVNQANPAEPTQTKKGTYAKLDEMFEKKVPTRKLATYVTDIQSAGKAGHDSA